MDRHALRLAGAMVEMASLLKVLIEEAPEDEDITFMVHMRDNLLSWSTILAPPGEPEGGYPQDGAKVFNIESERAKRRRG